MCRADTLLTWPPPTVSSPATSTSSATVRPSGRSPVSTPARRTCPLLPEGESAAPRARRRAAQEALRAGARLSAPARQAHRRARRSRRLRGRAAAAGVGLRRLRGHHDDARSAPRSAAPGRSSPTACGPASPPARPSSRSPPAPSRSSTRCGPTSCTATSPSSATATRCACSPRPSSGLDPRFGQNLILDAGLDERADAPPRDALHRDVQPLPLAPALRGLSPPARQRSTSTAEVCRVAGHTAYLSWLVAQANPRQAVGSSHVCTGSLALWPSM